MVGCFFLKKKLSAADILLPLKIHTMNHFSFLYEKSTISDAIFLNGFFGSVINTIKLALGFPLNNWKLLENF